MINCIPKLATHMHTHTSTHTHTHTHLADVALSNLRIVCCPLAAQAAVELCHELFVEGQYFLYVTEQCVNDLRGEALVILCQGFTMLSNLTGLLEDVLCCVCVCVCVCV